MVPKLRSLADFIRTNERMPSATELQQFGGVGNLSNTTHGSEAFDRQLAYLEQVADFIELKQRIPTEEELPDPF